MSVRQVGANSRKRPSARPAARTGVAVPRLLLLPAGPSQAAALKQNPQRFLIEGPRLPPPRRTEFELGVHFGIEWNTPEPEIYDVWRDDKDERRAVFTVLLFCEDARGMEVNETMKEMFGIYARGPVAFYKVSVLRSNILPPTQSPSALSAKNMDSPGSFFLDPPTPNDLVIAMSFFLQQRKRVRDQIHTFYDAYYTEYGNYKDVLLDGVADIDTTLAPLNMFVDHADTFSSHLSRPFPLIMLRNLHTVEIDPLTAGFKTRTLSKMPPGAVVVPEALGITLEERQRLIAQFVDQNHAEARRHMRDVNELQRERMRQIEETTMVAALADLGFTNDEVQPHSRSSARRPPKPGESSGDCVICDERTTLHRWGPCPHLFCDPCIKHWHKKLGNLTCPLCRGPRTRA